MLKHHSKLKELWEKCQKIDNDGMVTLKEGPEQDAFLKEMQRIMKEGVIQPCRHEASDAILLSFPPQFRCKKCGIIYK